MKKNVIGIIIVILLVETSFSVMGTVNDKMVDPTVPLNADSNSTDVFWSENFDSYVLGQCLDGGSDDGGWEAFWNDPVNRAYVVNNQYHSAPHSVEIYNESDIVHRFSGVYSGNWTFTSWVYVSSDYKERSCYKEFGGSYIYFVSYYKYKPRDFYTQLGIVFNGTDGLVYDRYTQKNLNLITDRWVEIRVEIYFEDDWFKCYYNDKLLVEDEWTEGWSYDTDSDGFLNLAGVNFCWGDYPIYHDDLSLKGESTGMIPDLECEGSIIWKGKTRETHTGYFTVENKGMANSRLEWIVDDYPEWGEWSFQPKFGRLTPEDDPMTVEVTVTAPERRGEYEGVIKVISVGDTDDYHEIPVHGTFHKNKQYIENPFQTFLENHPNLFPLLRQILEL